jgi:hypothetical protein
MINAYTTQSRSQVADFVKSTEESVGNLLSLSSRKQMFTDVISQ